MRFNINNKVRVKLTDLGRAILRAQHEALRSAYARVGPYKPTVEDAEGWSEFQAWDLMRTFGSNITMGCTLPFDVEIEISEASL